MRGGSGHALVALKYSVNTWERCGGEDGGGRAGGEAREGFGHALAGFIYFLKHLQKGLGMPGAVCVLEAAGAMWAVRARGGLGTHWQPFNTL